MNRMWRTDSLEKTLMLGKIEGRRRKRRQRMRWLDGITDSMDMSFSKLLVCCGPWGSKESDTIERLNWTEVYVSGEAEHETCDACFSHTYSHPWTCNKAQAQAVSRMNAFPGLLNQRFTLLLAVLSFSCYLYPLSYNVCLCCTPEVASSWVQEVDSPLERPFISIPASWNVSTHTFFTSLCKNLFFLQFHSYSSAYVLLSPLLLPISPSPSDCGHLTKSCP